jgi:hypothetical protein
MDLKDKVQVRVLRKRLKLSPDQFAVVVRKAGKFEFSHHEGSWSPWRPRISDLSCSSLRRK